MDGSYDEALERLHRTGPEYDDGLSNHGPMAVDALTRMGMPGRVHPWTDRYARKLDDLPRGRPLDDWRGALGRRDLLGDWLATFDRETAEQPWQDVLTTWWPRLLPGLVAAATHGVIRTGHAVRALREQETAPRVAELGQALASWAARVTPLPPGEPRGHLPPTDAYDRLPPVAVTGSAGIRAAALAGPWSDAVASAQSGTDLAAFDGLVDAAVSRYARWAPASPTMLVHMATAPRAVALVLPSLPTAWWPQAYDEAWRVSAAIASMYRPSTDPPVDAHPGSSAGAAAALAADCGDEHAIKLTEVALESHARGNPDALTAAAMATALAEV